MNQLGMLARVEHASMAVQFEPREMRVVHHKEGNPIGDADVARAEKLAVTLKSAKPMRFGPTEDKVIDIDLRYQVFETILLRNG
ncbi:MAG: hypothetical protein WB696_19380 [Chthoniobacterales bacterium]